MYEEEKKIYQDKLNELGLCEKVGINGHIMLYPKKAKEKKWHSKEYEVMVDRLYQPKSIDAYPTVRPKPQFCRFSFKIDFF